MIQNQDQNDPIDADLQQALDGLEPQRVAARKIDRFATWAFMLGFGGFFLSCAAGLLQMISRLGSPVSGIPDGYVAAGLCILTCFVALYVRGSRRVSYHDKLRTAVVSVACKSMENASYSPAPNASFPVDAFRATELMPLNAVSASRKREPFADEPFEVIIQHHFTGRHRDTAFELVEVRPANPKPWSIQTILLAIEVPIVFEGSIVIARKRGMLINWLERLLGDTPPIKLDNPAFDARFEMFTENTNLVGRLITPDLAKSLVAIDDIPWFARIEAAFHQNALLLALPTKRKFLGSQTRGLLARLSQEDFNEMQENLRIPYRIIDILHGADPR